MLRNHCNLDVISHCCEVEGCSEDGERAHLVTRATLPKVLWEDPRFFIYLCRKHHNEQHAIGIVSFCDKHNFARKLVEAMRQRSLEMASL